MIYMQVAKDGLGGLTAYNDEPVKYSRFADKGGESSETLHDPDTGTRLIGVPLNRRGKDHVAVRQSIQSRCRRLMGDSLISLYIGVYFHRNHCKPPGLRIRKLFFRNFICGGTEAEAAHLADCGRREGLFRPLEIFGQTIRKPERTGPKDLWIERL